MFLHDPRLEQIEADLRELETARHKEIAQLMALAGDALVDLEGLDTVDLKGCGCKDTNRGKKRNGGAAKASNRDDHSDSHGASGTGDDGGDDNNNNNDDGDDNNDEDLQDVYEEYQQWYEEYEQWYNEQLARVREEVEEEIANGCPLLIPHTERTMRPPSAKKSVPKRSRHKEGSAKVSSTNEIGIRRAYQDTEEYLHDTIEDLYEQAGEKLEEYKESYFTNIFYEASGISCGTKTVGDCTIGNPCTSMPPCVDTKTIDDFWNLDFDAALDNISSIRWVKGASRADVAWEVTLIKAAFALLRDNLDIINWIEMRITNENKLINFLLNDKVHLKISGTKGDFYSYSFPNITILPQSEKFGKNYVIPWKRPVDPDIDRLLIAIDLSGTLLHELVHVVGYEQAIGDEPNKCFISYIIENMYRWAMFTRFGQATASLCSPVQTKAIDTLWGNDGSIFPKRTCIGNNNERSVFSHISISW